MSIEKDGIIYDLIMTKCKGNTIKTIVYYLNERLEKIIGGQVDKNPVNSVSKMLTYLENNKTITFLRL